MHTVQLLNLINEITAVNLYGDPFSFDANPGRGGVTSIGE